MLHSGRMAKALVLKHAYSSWRLVAKRLEKCGPPVYGLFAPNASMHPKGFIFLVNIFVSFYPTDYRAWVGHRSYLD